MNQEKVTHSAGVPTVWLGMFEHMDATGEAPDICSRSRSAARPRRAR